MKKKKKKRKEKKIFKYNMYWHYSNDIQKVKLTKIIMINIFIIIIIKLN